MSYLYYAILGLFIILLVLTPLYYYLSHHKKNIFLRVGVKGLATGISLFFALAGYIRISHLGNTADVPFTMTSKIFLLAGLSICLLADISICFNLLIGGFLFLTGHVAYLIFFLLLTHFNPLSILIFTILIVAFLCYFYRYLVTLKKLAIPIFIYGTLLFASLSIGVMLPLSIGSCGFPCAIAIALLVIGDLIYFYDHIVKETPASKTLELLYYFSGQFLMAMTLYLPTII